MGNIKFSKINAIYSGQYIEISFVLVFTLIFHNFEILLSQLALDFPQGDGWYLRFVKDLCRKFYKSAQRLQSRVRQPLDRILAHSSSIQKIEESH